MNAVSHAQQPDLFCGLRRRLFLAEARPASTHRLRITVFRGIPHLAITRTGSEWPELDIYVIGDRVTGSITYDSPGLPFPETLELSGTDCQRLIHLLLSSFGGAL